MTEENNNIEHAHIVTPWIAESLFKSEHFSPIGDGEDETDYFRRLLASSEKAKEALRTHETWKRRHLNGLRPLDCKQRILIVLEELLKSDFLRHDWFDTGIPREDREQAAVELREQGFEELLLIDGAEWKFALLSQLRRPAEKRIVIDERNAGIYISEMRDKLSNEAVESFFRFVTFTRLSYEEIDRLNSEKPAVRRHSMKSELTPEQKAVRAFAEKIIALADAAYEQWNGKRIVPGAHKAEVEIVINKEKLIQRMQSRVKNDFNNLLSVCYPETANTKRDICLYVVQLQKDGYFGKLTNKHLAELLAPIVGLSKGTVTNYLSQA